MNTYTYTLLCSNSGCFYVLSFFGASRTKTISHPMRTEFFPPQPSRKAPPVFAHVAFKNGARMLRNMAAPFSNARRGPFLNAATLPMSAFFARSAFIVLSWPKPTPDNHPPPKTTHILRLLNRKYSRHFRKFRWITLAPHQARSETPIFAAFLQHL